MLFCRLNSGWLSHCRPSIRSFSFSSSLLAPGSRVSRLFLKQEAVTHAATLNTVHHCTSLTRSFSTIFAKPQSKELTFGPRTAVARPFSTSDSSSSNEPQNPNSKATVTIKVKELWRKYGMIGIGTVCLSQNTLRPIFMTKKKTVLWHLFCVDRVFLHHRLTRGRHVQFNHSSERLISG